MQIADNNCEQLIQAVEQADSADALLEAVENLSEARYEEAIPILIKVLGYNNPGAAVAAVDGLISLGEVAVTQLLDNIDGYNYGARAWATRACAGVGDPRALDLLLDAASSDFSFSVRRAAARGLGLIKWSKLAPEAIKTAQNRVLETLLLVSQDGEWVVRYAAVVGLENLALSVAETQIEIGELILAKLGEMMEQEPEMAVRARIQWAIQKLG